MTSSIIIEPGFGDTRQRTRWWEDTDGAWATTLNDVDDSVKVTWDLRDYMDSDAGESVSSVAFEDSGVTTSSKVLFQSQETFVMTGCGETKVTATFSTGRKLTRFFRIYETNANPRLRDYR